MEQRIILCTALTGALFRLVIEETELPVVHTFTALWNHELKPVHLPNIPRQNLCYLAQRINIRIFLKARYII